MSLLRTILIKAPRGAPLAATKRYQFSTSPYAQKEASETVKETIDSVNKKVGDAAVKGIEKGQQATSTLKSTVGLNAKQAEGSAKEMAGEATGKAHEMTGEASGKTQEMAGQAKGKTQEMAGQAKGKTQEVAGQAKGKAEEVKGKM